MNTLEITDNEHLNSIINKVTSSERVTFEDALFLYKASPLFILMELSMIVKRRLHGSNIFFNKNFHIEPTNICRFDCKFCSYRKTDKDSDSWDMSLDDIKKNIEKHYHKDITEIHLVGGVNPKYDFEYYKNMIRLVRNSVPKNVSIKAFSAVEHIAVIKEAGLSFAQGIKELKESGMDTITGGGAEIFDEGVRKQICNTKATSLEWLTFHRELHIQNIKTNATMLYGHIETIEQRIEHMQRLRCMQDETSGFESFIPLKFRSKNNSMQQLGECSIIDDLRTLAISRIYLDNIPHIKAYWPMYGKNTTQMAILAGADDVDGTLQDTTKIYSMSGVDSDCLSESELRKMAEEIGMTLIERDTFYNKI